ncbi:hypothetical protein BDZ89DRAFT_233469 [Hymenopellis radicata]|nr:hypothetical protein BDZ89DRAFT_233469 [Hymenopellis radicata]
MSPQQSPHCPAQRNGSPLTLSAHYFAQNQIPNVFPSGTPRLRTATTVVSVGRVSPLIEAALSDIRRNKGQPRISWKVGCRRRGTYSLATAATASSTMRKPTNVGGKRRKPAAAATRTANRSLVWIRSLPYFHHHQCRRYLSHKPLFYSQKRYAGLFRLLDVAEYGLQREHGQCLQFHWNNHCDSHRP